MAPIMAASRWSTTPAVDSGEIVVQVVTGRAKHRLLWNWFATCSPAARARKETRDRFPRAASCGSITEPPLPISIDGEVLGHTPASGRGRREGDRGGGAG